MRQLDDIIFQNLLRHARAATLTEDDLTLLNSRVISSLLTPNLEAATTVVKLNYLRHHINRIRLEHFARARSQKIYVFPAHHSRTKSSSSSRLCAAEELLQQNDNGSIIPFPGLFLYSLNMPCILLSNTSTPLGLVNGARGTAAGIAVDPTGKLL